MFSKSKYRDMGSVLCAWALTGCSMTFYGIKDEKEPPPAKVATTCPVMPPGQKIAARPARPLTVAAKAQPAPAAEPLLPPPAPAAADKAAPPADADKGVFSAAR